jgi:RNA polymerase sigma-70 factor (ECF subfamily)
MVPSKGTVHPSARAAAGPADRSGDLALVERVRSGDLAAFEELYRAHAGRLYSVACRMLGSPADAEDLLQDIFLAAHRKLDSFRGESALGTWLYRLATNLCLDHLRSRAARSNQLTDPLDDEPGLADAGGRGLADRTVTKMDLERALAQLPEGCRAAFVLHDIEGLEHREVAQALGIAEGTSKSQVHKARLRLRALLSGSLRPERSGGLPAAAPGPSRGYGGEPSPENGAAAGGDRGEAAAPNDGGRRP